MLPIVATLLSSGLSLIANAVIAKGQDVVEKELGVKIDTASSATLRELEMKHEEFLVNASVRKQEMDMEAEKVAQVAVSDRWKADMLSDSWLSKNIRPLVLIYLLGAYTVFSIGSGVDFQITQAYVELLAQMLMLVMGAYFAGRTIEKIVDMREKGKQ
jgi:hypothetical protein